MVSNIHDTTFFIKHIQDIFCFFSVFTDFPSSAWQQAVHFSARHLSNLTCSLYVRLPLVPRVDEASPPLHAKVKHFALLFQLSSKLLLMDPRPLFLTVVARQQARCPGTAEGIEGVRWPCGVDCLLIFTFSRNGPRLAPPLGGAERQRTNRNKVRSLIKKKKKVQKRYYFHPDKKERLER